MLIAAGVLNRALKTLVHLVPKRSSLSILEHVLLEPADHGLVITGTNLTTEARLVIPATDAFTACLSVRPLLDAVAALARDAEVTITTRGDAICVIAGGTTTVLPKRPVSEFPERLTHTENPIVVPDPDALMAGLAWVARALGTDPSRPHLSGVLFEGDVIVGCGGHRLHQIVVAGLAVSRVLVPGDAVAMILRALQDQPLAISVDASTLRVSSPAVSVTTRLVDGVYPAYAQVIPKRADAAFSMRVDAVELTAGLKRVWGRAPRRSAATTKLRANGAITLETSLDDVQRVATVGVLATTHEGDDHVQGFNPWYLAEAIAGHDAAADLRFFDVDSPLLIEAGDRTAVVMPCRL